MSVDEIPYFSGNKVELYYKCILENENEQIKKMIKDKNQSIKKNQEGRGKNGTNLSSDSKCKAFTITIISGIHFFI